MSVPRLPVLACLLPLLAWAPAVEAADHDDTPTLRTQNRHDARLTDLHVFTRGQNLVISLTSNPAIPRSAPSYVFPSDLKLRITIDDDSEVRFDDPQDLATYGGTIVRPDHVRADKTFDIEFDSAGTPRIRAAGSPRVPRSELQFFAGLRDDPFIRGPRIGRNVAATVIELPLHHVTRRQPTILVWATSHVPTIEGDSADLAARALRSQFAENMELNSMHPRRHEDELTLKTDVVIFDTSRAAMFPNGRDLLDDVVDLVGDSRVLTTDAPFPSQNDLPFLPVFPYLAPPHPPVP